MKNILAITAYLKKFSIAISYNGNVYELNESKDSAQYIVHCLHEFIDIHNIDLHNIDYIITSSGPGSFTGIRVAQSLVKGLSLALGVDAMCVNYFDVVKNISSIKSDIEQLVVLKSEKDQIYYDFCGQQGVTSLENILSIKNNTSCALIGDAVDDIIKYCDVFEYVEKITAYDSALHLLHIPFCKNVIRPLYINAK